MKTAAKVFIVIGCMFSFYLVYPVVIAYIAINKINNATHKSELTTMGVITLLFCSFLGGIFMLCIGDGDLANSPAPLIHNVQTNEKNEETAYEKLNRLKKLYDEGIIDEETYQKKRAEYLNEM